MTKYLIRKICLKHSIPEDIVNLIAEYMDSYQLINDIKNKLYIKNGFWFSRITCRNVYEIKKHHVSYYTWYRIFHYKDYSMVIKYEALKLKELLKSHSKEQIEEIHLENLKNCHLRNFFNFRTSII